MRHNIKGKKLGRTASHKSAVLNSLAISLLRHKRIRTTLAKAKEARGFVEGIITKARKNDLNARRQVMKVINDKEVVKELFNDIVPKVGERPGGYTRVIKLGNRKGDAASMAIIELVDYNDVANKKAEALKDKKELKKEAKKKGEGIEEAKIVEEVDKVEESKSDKEKKDTKAKKETKSKTKTEKKEKTAKEAKVKKETKSKKESKPKEEESEKKDKKKN
jgi:large subunit ribosomal protein L17